MALHISTKNRYVPQWDDNNKAVEGEQISCEYRTMSVKDVLAIQEETGFNILTGDGEGENAFTTNWSVMSAVLKEYTTDWRNVIVDGEAITAPAEVLDALSLRYLGLFGEIFQYILVASIGTDDDAKNFKPGSAQKEPESGLTVEPATSKESETVEEST